MKKGRIGILCILIVGLFTSGCMTQKGMTLDEIKDNCIHQFHALISYSFSTNYSTITETSNSTEINSNPFPTMVYGTVDLENKEYYVRLNGSYSTSEGMVTVERQDYLVGGVLYRQMTISNISQWGKANASGTEYILFNGTSQVDMLNVSDLTLLKDSVIESRPCYSIKADVDVRKFYEKTLSGFVDRNLANETLNKAINRTKEWTLTFWVDKETFHLLKVYQKTIMEYQTPFSRTTEEGVTVFRDQNLPVQIKLPQGARDANWTTFGY